MKIAKTFLWVTLFALAARAIAGLKEIAVAWRYGTSAYVDAFGFAFSIVDWPVALAASMALSLFVPIVMGSREHAPAALARFKGELLGAAIVVGTLLMLMFLCLTPLLSHAQLKPYVTGLGPDVFTVYPWLTLNIALGVMAAALAAILMAHDSHANTMSEGMTPLCLLVCVSIGFTWVPSPLVFGTLLGSACMVALLCILLACKGQFVRPTFSFASPLWKDVREMGLVLLFGQTLLGFSFVLDRFFAAALGPSSVAALGYASRLIAVLSSLATLVIYRVMLSEFSAHAATQTRAEVSARAKRWAKRTFAAGVCTALLGLPLTGFAVRLLFERGAFTAADTAVVSGLTQAFLLQLPVMFAIVVLNSATASQRRFRVLGHTGIVGFLVKLVFAPILSASFGVAGIIYATALAFTAMFAHLYWALDHDSNASERTLGR